MWYDMSMTTTDERQIEYMALSELMTRLHPQNPKSHDLGAIIQSYKTHGFVASGILDDRTGLFLAGHGRVQALASMKSQKMDAPGGIRNGGDDWLVPVQVGYESESDTQALAYLAADNKLTMAGGWNEPALAALLQEVANSVDVVLESTGFDADELDDLINDLHGGKGEADKQGLVISPELFERHDYIVLYFDNDFDWNVAKEWFGVQPSSVLFKDGTVKQKGLGRVINGADFLRKLHNEQY